MALRRVKMRYFAITLVPICIFYVNSVITGHMFASDLNVPQSILQDGRHWMESAGRFRFLAATWLFASLVVLAVALLVRDLMEPTAKETRAAAIGTMIVIFILSVMPTIEHFSDPDGHRIYHLLGADIFKGALSRGALPGCNGPDDTWLLGRCGEIPVITLLNAVLDIINVLAGLGVGALTVGMVLCLETRPDDGIEKQAALLAKNLRSMRHQLYLSGLVLTFGMFFVTSWMYWPLPFIVDAEMADYRSVVMASALFTGIYFTLLILSFYLPVALILDGRVRHLADVAGSTDLSGDAIDVDGWRATHGLKEGTSDYIRAGLALAAPILAAFAGGITPISL